MNFKERMKAKTLSTPDPDGQELSVFAVNPSGGPVSRWGTNADGIPIEGKIAGYTGHVDPYVAMKEDPGEVYAHYLSIHLPGGDKLGDIEKARKWGQKEGLYES